MRYQLAKLSKANGERGMKCIVPDTIKNDLRLETKISSACRDIHKVSQFAEYFQSTSGLLPVYFFIKIFRPNVER